MKQTKNSMLGWRGDTSSNKKVNVCTVIKKFHYLMFQIVTSIEEARNLQVNAPSAEGKGRAKYRFKGETANELSVNKVRIKIWLLW